jgi:hypothetical protein
MGTTNSALDGAPVDIVERFEFGQEGHGPLRVLCLHGHGSNTDISKMQIDNLNLVQTYGISCDYFQGSFETGPRSDMMRHFSQQPFRSWAPSATTSKDEKELVKGLMKSFSDILYVLKKFGPYDGVYGFSLGGLMCACISCPAVWRDMFHYEECPFKFIISACGGGSSYATTIKFPIAANTENIDNSGRDRVISHVSTVEETTTTSDNAATILPFDTLCDDDRLKLPSLHLIGKRDPGRNDSECISTWFMDSNICLMNTSHEIPMTVKHDKPTQSALKEFFEKRSVLGYS